MILIAIRDDPLIVNLRPAILKAYLDEIKERDVQNHHTGKNVLNIIISVFFCKYIKNLILSLSSDEEEGLDPALYCLCKNCTKKETLTESVCCKCMKINAQVLGRMILLG